MSDTRKRMTELLSSLNLDASERRQILDVVEQFREEREALALSDVHIRALLKTTVDAIITIDSDGTVLSDDSMLGAMALATRKKYSAIKHGK